MRWVADYRALLSGQRRSVWASLMRGLLYVASGPYRAVVAARNRRFDRDNQLSQRVPVPVISVGNLTTGGTGKTPMVAWLARWFRRQGIRVSIISRGYGAAAGQRNDEAQELEAKLPDVPHLQNPDRVAAANVAVDELATQLILLDDAFQHRRIHRDLDLVLLDATNPFGYDQLLPRGLLREPVTSLRRANVVAVTRSELVAVEVREQIQQRVQRLAPAAIYVETEQIPIGYLSASGRQLPLSHLQQRPVAAFCGIGNPEAFFATLQRQGCLIHATRVFADHFDFGAASMATLADWASHATNVAAVVCTHKDLVKIGADRLGPHPLFALQIDVAITTGLSNLETKLRDLLARVPPDED